MTASASIVLVAPSAVVLAALPDEPLASEARARRDRLRARQDRSDFTAARLLASLAHRALTGEVLPPAALVQRCAECGGPHGRPLPTPEGVHLSWAHAGGWVAAAAGARRLGVDVEPVPARSTGVPEAALTPEELRLAAADPQPATAALRAWTAKEALIKAGVARLDDLGRLPVLTDAGVGAHAAGLALASRTFDGAVAAVAADGAVRWLTLGTDGEPVAAPPLVGGAA